MAAANTRHLSCITNLYFVQSHRKDFSAEIQLIYLLNLLKYAFYWHFRRSWMSDCEYHNSCSCTRKLLWRNRHHRMKWTWRIKFKSDTRLFAFYVSLVKLWIQIFSFLLLVKSRETVGFLDGCLVGFMAYQPKSCLLIIVKYIWLVNKLFVGNILN